MKIYYSDEYNIDLDKLEIYHPFDGMKFKKIYQKLNKFNQVKFDFINDPVEDEIVNNFIDDSFRRLLLNNEYISYALGIQSISLNNINKYILLPMKFGVKGTIQASLNAIINNENGWNLSGGYHHACKDSTEGFCIYNDIGIAYESHIKNDILNKNDKILIIDVDAHHGNGNANVFMNNNNVTILDVYNKDNYPTDKNTRNRINISVPLDGGTSGDIYLKLLNNALCKLKDKFKMTFVVAGTDVLNTDLLGGLRLSIEDCIKRDKMIIDKLNELSVPFCFLGGGGYSNESVIEISKSILENIYKKENNHD